MSPNRPLRRRDTHIVLQFVLPLIAVFSWYIAYSWLAISPEELENSIALRTLDDLPLNLDAWAFFVGLGAAAMTVALIRERKGLYVYALALVLGVFLVLSTIYAVAAFYCAVSSSAWAWPAFVVVVCFGCIKALTSREA